MPSRWVSPRNGVGTAMAYVCGSPGTWTLYARRSERRRNSLGPVTAPRSRLRTVGSTEIADALASALDGGPVVAPLAPDPVERRRALAVLRPDQPVLEPDAAVVVTTSGSTGRPKAAVLSGSAIRASVAATHARLGGVGDWVLALPGHYVAGLMVLARAVIAGTEVLLARPDLADLRAVARTRA